MVRRRVPLPAVCCSALHRGRKKGRGLLGALLSAQANVGAAQQDYNRSVCFIPGAAHTVP